MDNREQNTKELLNQIEKLFDPDAELEDAIYDRISWSGTTADYDPKREI